MIILLYGENEVGILKRKDLIKTEFSLNQTFEFDGKSVEIEKISQALGSQSLFGEDKRLVIINGLLQNKTLLEELIIPSSDTTLVIIETKKVTAAQITSLQKKLPGILPQEYKVDSAIFRFVEALGVSNKTALLLLQTDLKDEAREIIFAMIIRQFRLLLLVKEQSVNGPEDFQRMSPWQKQKLDAQASHFTSVQLKAIYKELLVIDSQNKTGQFPGTLSDALELFILKSLPSKN